MGIRIIERTGWLALAAAIALIGALVLWPHRAPAQQTNLGPFQTNLTVTNSAQMAAIGANPSRRGFVICNGNATGTNNVYVTFGPNNTPSATAGVVIPGGTVVASCWTGPVIGTGSGPVGGMGAQINLFATASTNVTVLEF